MVSVRVQEVYFFDNSRPRKAFKDCESKLQLIRRECEISSISSDGFSFEGF